MQKKYSGLLSLVLASGLYADGMTDLTHQGDVRVGVQYHDSEGTSGTDIAVGGALALEKRVIDSVYAGLGFHTSQSLFNQNDAYGVPFYDSQSRGYAILSQAYIRADLGAVDAVFGRQIIDTPFLDSDDIGMVPNSFEALSVSYEASEAMHFYYAYVRSMSGVDAEIHETFSDINGGAGAHIAGIGYEGIENASFSGWYYLLPTQAKMAYLEGAYEGSQAGIHYALGVQAAFQTFQGDMSNDIFGASVTLGYGQLPFRFNVAYNETSGVAADNGFGGGPFFTSSENMTLAEAGDDGTAVLYGMDWEINDKMMFSALRVDLEDRGGNKGDETDFVFNYTHSETMTFDLIYSTIENSDISGDSFDNVRLFVNYSF